MEDRIHLYQVGKLVARNPRYRLYLCEERATGRLLLFQIAAERAFNSIIERATFVLVGELERRAKKLEDEYAVVKLDPKVMLNYQLGFPEVVDGFESESQDGRRVNILSFRMVDDVRHMVPLSRFIKAGQYVDPRTSVWVFGKTMKTLVLAHDLGIANNRLDADNIMIEPDQHYAIVFDWTEAEIHTEEIPPEVRRTEITNAAEAVIALLGGTRETRVFPHPKTEENNRYIKHLLELASGRQASAATAHEEFYQLVDSLWAREFHPFTSYER